MLANFRKRTLGIQDELARDVMGGVERLRIDILEQHVVDETDERRNPRDLLLAARLKKNPDAAFVDGAWPFHQKPGFFQPPDLGRDMGRGERDVIGKAADRDPAGALRVGHAHQHDELAGREVEFLAEGVAAGEQSADALHHRVDAATKLRIGPFNQEFFPGDGHGSLVNIGFWHLASCESPTI
jgi:hypothetical protein